MTQISATTVAYSKAPTGEKLWSGIVTLPRFILAELNTHRMLSKNSASSRAIPFNKMVESVQNDPFIPIAWQKEHKGMQGSEYLEHGINDLIDNHLRARDFAVERAIEATQRGLTKQIANRYLEPFMWHTVLISGTEWENFFNLRCPQYEFNEISQDGTDEIINTLNFRSKKDYCKHFTEDGYKLSNVYIQSIGKTISEFNDLDWLKVNKGQAEIHMMALVEAIYDAMNESTPRELKDGEWHIPFRDKIAITENWNEELESLINTPFENQQDVKKSVELLEVKISTAMCARTSYTTVGEEKEFTLEQQIALHDKLTTSGHYSPFEHCARVMTNEEYNTNVKGQLSLNYVGTDIVLYEADRDSKDHLGWCNNFRGFIQYRHFLEKNLI